ncbi:MAG TPA: hypothetical protein VMC02_02785 [Steroidobacteraceae bacterium]|nr:hypothetical protein [Steroidobacteraceae bacterium]
MIRVLAAFCGFVCVTGVASAAPECDRTCLYQVLDHYLAALKAGDASRAGFAPGARTSENNVMLRPGDGMWGTITALGAYDLRFADPQTGAVGFYGVVRETDTDSPFAVRLKVRGRLVTEAETIVARPQEAGVPFVTADIKPLAVLNEVVPAAARSSRERLIAIANGYFDTIQLNDGTLHTAFSDDCNRREDGFQTTNRTDDTWGDITHLGCGPQFSLGWYRYDDRLRDRRFLVVDQERGLVMAAGFIDHEGRLGDYKLADGRTASSKLFRHPHTYCLLETFKIRGGKIQQVEAVFTTVPYYMPTPWAAPK